MNSLSPKIYKVIKSHFVDIHQPHCHTEQQCVCQLMGQAEFVPGELLMVLHKLPYVNIVSQSEKETFEGVVSYVIFWQGRVVSICSGVKFLRAFG